MGAPEAETPQAGVYRGGAVYKCDIAADDRCMLINFDSKGNNNFTSLFFFFNHFSFKGRLKSLYIVLQLS